MQPREGLVPARRAGEGEEPSVRGGEGRPIAGVSWAAGPAGQAPPAGSPEGGPGCSSAATLGTWLDQQIPGHRRLTELETPGRTQPRVFPRPPGEASAGPLGEPLLYIRPGAPFPEPTNS